MTTTTTKGIRSGRHLTRPRHLTPRQLAIRIGGRMLTGLLLVALTLTLVIGYGMLDNRWYRVVGVEGGSMAPTIQMGDLIFIGRADHLEIDDIGVFQVNGKVVTHRVVGIGPDGSYLTQGDANPTPDRWNGASVEVVGKYLFRVPLIGSAFSSGIGAWFTASDRLTATISGAGST
ncbi:MAG: signal peptidase I [Acidimicrobiia bacterium]